MSDLDYKPNMVGRNQELTKLKLYLNRAMNSEGNTVFIQGEAGVGKTKLLNELLRYARSKGVSVLHGWSLYESLTPYMPFVDALRCADLGHLFSREEPPRVECVYLITNSGLLVRDILRKETELDSNIFAAMLTTVGNFVRDSLSMLSGEDKNEALSSLGYEKYQILIESGVDSNLVVIITGKENEFLINDMKEILTSVEEKYGDFLKSWDGDDRHIKGIDLLLNPLVSSGKFDGIDYAKYNPKIKRNILFENILLGLTRYTRKNPSILAIEDLQWADPSTITLMHYISRNTRDTNLLILGTFRPEDVALKKDGKVHHLVETMQLMNREDLFNRIELARLNEVDIDEMLFSIFGRFEFSDDFKDQIFRETEGNPFFVIELLRMLVTEDVIGKEGEIWTLKKGIEEVDIPSRVQDVIVRRLNRVKVEMREILDYGAVMGLEFTSDILASAINMDKVRLLKQLRILQQDHKLIYSIGDSYKFDHSKIKEVLYKEIPSELLMEYHDIIAHSIERHNRGNLQDVIGDLAFHYYRCRDKEKALPYLLSAAKKANDQYAPQEEYNCYRWALNIVDSFEDTLENKKKKLTIIMALGENCFLRGEWDDASDNFEIAIKITEEVEDDRKKAECFQGLGRIHTNRNEWENAINKFNKGLEISEKINDSHLTASLSYSLGNIFEARGDNKKAMGYYQKCMEIGFDTNDSREIADAYLGIGRILAKRGEYQQSVRSFEKAVEIYKKIEDIRELTKAYANLGATYTYIDCDKGLEYHKMAMEMADRVYDIRVKGYGLMNKAYTFIKQDKLDLAFDDLNKALNIFEKLGERMPISMVYSNFGAIYTKMEEWEQAIDYFNRALDICNELKIPYNCGCVYYEYGIMHNKKGEVPEARDRLTKSLEIFKSIQNNDMIKKVEKELRALHKR